MTSFMPMSRGRPGGGGLLSAVACVMLLLLGHAGLLRAQTLEPAPAAPAAWWAEKGLINGEPPDENGVLLVGQLKNVVWNVGRWLDYRFTAQGGCGDELRPIMRSWDWAFPAAASSAYHYLQPATDKKNKYLVNQGQLKNMALLVYRRLKALGQPIVLKGRHPTTGALQDVVVDPDVPATLPWGSGENSAPARVGHLKYLFSFELDSSSRVVGWGNNQRGQLLIPGGLEDAVAIAAGTYHNLALKADGTIVAWGDNGSDQCLVPAWLNDATAIAAGSTHSLALRRDGTLAAWGSLNFGNALPAGLNQVVAIAAADNHSLALKADGTVVIWGNSNTPGLVTPAGLADVVAIATGSYHHLALKSDGTVVGWGNDTYGQSTVPAGLGGVAAIAAGTTFSLALKHDGTVVVWGGSTAERPFLVPPGDLNDVASIAAGGHAMALKRDGTVVAWGFEGYGIPGNAGSRTVPPGLAKGIAIAAGERHSLALTGQDPVFTSPAWFNVSADDALSGIYYRSVVVNAPGAIFSATGLPPGLSIDPATGLVSGTPSEAGTWTATLTATMSSSSVDQRVTFRLTDFLPELSSPLSENAPVFQAYSRPLIMRHATSTVVTGLPPGLTYDAGTQLISGTPTQAGTYTVTTTGTSPLGTQASQFQFFVRNVVAWGENLNGETSVPQLLGHVTAIDSGVSFSLALAPSGGVVGWGRAVGGGTAVPVGLTDVVAIAAGNDHGLALKSDRTVVGWGSNEYGKATVPGGLTGAVAIAAGAYHSMVLRDTGTVVAWGRTYSAQNVPPGLRSVVAIAVGGNYGVALKDDGTVVNWSLDSFVYDSVPDGLAGVVAIAAGESHRLALRGDGTLVAWGSNAFGQTDVPAGLTGVVAIEAGATHSVALKNDGTLVVWGFAGEPVPTGLDRVVAIAAGSRFTVVLQAPDTTTPVIISPSRSIGAENPSSATGIYYRTQVVNGPATYSATGLPPGLVLDPATGIVSGTPTTPPYAPEVYPPGYPSGYGNMVTVKVTATLSATTPAGTATKKVEFVYPTSTP